MNTESEKGIMSKTRDEALAHFGVKGMRWGVRNDPKPSDQDEPPTFFRVDKKSGQVEDFQPWDLPDPQDFEKAFLA